MLTPKEGARLDAGNMVQGQDVVTSILLLLKFCEGRSLSFLYILSSSFLLVDSDVFSYFCVQRLFNAGEKSISQEILLRF